MILYLNRYNKNACCTNTILEFIKLFLLESNIKLKRLFSLIQNILHYLPFEPRHEKIMFLHMRKQSRRSAVR